MEYKEKYIKYKNKYLLLKKIQKQIGGLIKGDDKLTKIESIGFEIESSDISPIIRDGNTFKPYGFNSILGSVIRIPIKNTTINKYNECSIFATQDSYILSDQIKTRKENEIDDLDVGYIITEYLKKSKIKTERDNSLVIEPKNVDSTYGSFEFIITYSSITPDKNIIYIKMISIYNFLDIFFKSCNIYDKFEIEFDKKKIIYYIYHNKDTDIYFMSDISPERKFKEIQFTPQITLGIDIINISLVYQYLSEDYANFGNKSLLQKLNEIDTILSENIFDIYINFNYISNFILLIYFFLNVNNITDYKYINDIIEIDRNTTQIKVRHKFCDIFNKLSINPEYSQEFSNFIGFIQQESMQIKIREYRINKINNLIATKIFELFPSSQRSRKFNAQIILLRNSNILWGNFTPYEITQIKEIFRSAYPDSIFQHHNIDEILQRIIDADYQFLTGNDRHNDSIVSGGTLFPYEKNILIELRYINKKNSDYQTISETKQKLDEINLEYIEEQKQRQRQRQRHRYSYHSEDDDSMDDED